MAAKMDDSSFCSPPKVRRSVCLTENLQVIESPDAGPFTQVFHSSSTKPSPSVWAQSRGTPAKFQISNAFYQDSVAMEGVLVDRAVDNLLSLPEVVGQVSAIQKDHHQEIQRQLAQLRKLEIEIQQSKEKHCGAMAEMLSVDRKTRITEEEVAEKEKLCQTYQKEIESLVTVCEKLRYKLRTKEDEIKTEESKNALYMSKMETHKFKVKEFESTLPAHKRLLDLQERLAVLKKQKQQVSEKTLEFTAVCAGEREGQINRDIDRMKMVIKTLNNEATVKQKQLTELKSQESKIQLAITVLHKRNAAQLTRLKRQVREQQLRHRQWQDQHAQLINSIADTRIKLEE